MFTDYYKNEMRALRELAGEFAQANPSLAGLLQGPSADPDVERILEGVAYLSADIRRKLDDEFPEILHPLVQAVCPQYLRPVPSATIVAFTPKVNLKQTLAVAAGTHMDSVPVGNAPCRFRTCLDVDVAPIELAAVERPDLAADAVQGDGIQIRLRIRTLGVGLSSIRLPRLRLFLAGDLGESADLYALLNSHLEDIRLEAAGAPGRVLPASALKPAGFDPEESLLPRNVTSLPAFGVLQDYFLFPEKYLFLDVDLSDWTDRGDGSEFTLTFQCRVPSFQLPQLSPERFVLHATPAVNLFSHEAEPVVIDHREAELLVQPSRGPGGETPQVFTVDRVEGIARGSSARRSYRPFSAFLAEKRDAPVYQTAFRRSRTGDGLETVLSIAFPPSTDLVEREILKLDLTCSDGVRPESLLAGDIRVPTRDTPELVTFRNLTAPTPSRLPPVGEDALWHLVAHLALNYLPVADMANLKTLLHHYVPAGGRERSREMANAKRIEGITGLYVTPDECLFGTSFIRGQALRVGVRADHFSGTGDRYLFGAVLNRFFASCAALNTYTALTLEDSASGETMQWPPQLGTQPLI